jgi:hypothetical protein
MLKLNVEKAPRKPRAKKPASIAPNYTLAPAEPCSFVAVSTPVPGPVNPPEFVAGTVSEIGGVEWSVSLFSDDTVKIHVNAARTPVAVGRFVTSTHRNEYGYSVSADIVDVTPFRAVTADILRDLSSNLTFFAMRAGRFSGVRS